MKLVSFSVKDFRSITSATEKILLSDYSLLIGANNEGKSNILHALKLAMTTLVHWEGAPSGLLERYNSPMESFALSKLMKHVKYNWKTDYPINKQERNYSKCITEVGLEFELSYDELLEFKKQINISLNGTLPLLFSFGRSSIGVSINKHGRGKGAITRKSAKIVDFISRKIKFVYIPSIRTSETADNIISDLVRPGMRKLLFNRDYVNALKRIEKLRQPVFDEVASAIQKNISDFLPSVKSVNLEHRIGYRHDLLPGDVNVMIDDGFPTILERKGDGIQSLVAIALMKYASERGEFGKNTIIAIEEPEAHLHPGAAHELTSVLNTLAENSQVVITSHSPYFVNLNYLQNTVIVNNNRAIQAKNISQIRDALGIRLSDNLQSAELVILVEGSCDVVALRSIFSERSKFLKSAMKANTVAIVGMNGVDSLSNMASFYKSCSCRVMCIIDGDRPAKKAAAKAIENRALEPNEVTYCSVPGMKESELEDLYDVNVYGKLFLDRFNVNLQVSILRKKSMKWSVRVESIFKHSGAHWDHSTMAGIKHWLSETASKFPESIISEEMSAPINNFISAVEAQYGN